VVRSDTDRRSSCSRGSRVTSKEKEAPSIPVTTDSKAIAVAANLGQSGVLLISSRTQKVRPNVRAISTKSILSNPHRCFIRERLSTAKLYIVEILKSHHVRPIEVDKVGNCLRKFLRRCPYAVLRFRENLVDMLPVAIERAISCSEMRFCKRPWVSESCCCETW